MSKREKKKLYKIIYAFILIAVLLLLEKFNLINIIDNNESVKLVESNVSERQEVVLDSCVDGDTAKFKLNDEVIKVRFLAIDTPETIHPYKNVEEYGKDASEYTCNRLTNAKKIEIQYEETYTKYDKYDRYLAWIWVDDNLLQKELISVGYAKIKYIYAKYKYTDELKEVELNAKEEKLGLWNSYEEIKYRDKEYSITFKYNNETKEVKVKEGETVELIDNPYKEGYTFAGWKYSNNLYDATTPVTKNLTLKASFTKNK